MSAQYQTIREIVEHSSPIAREPDTIAIPARVWDLLDPDRAYKTALTRDLESRRLLSLLPRGVRATPVWS